ncbi:MAG: hypothetical protein Q8P60_14215 [Pseudorhodobacter sp.]|nr:hypothetical protein [Pseudorhodobacter sp.]
MSIFQTFRDILVVAVAIPVLALIVLVILGSFWDADPETIH